jgi:hypothetical protein
MSSDPLHTFARVRMLALRAMLEASGKVVLPVPPAATALRGRVQRSAPVPPPAAAAPPPPSPAAAADGGPWSPRERSLLAHVPPRVLAALERALLAIARRPALLPPPTRPTAPPPPRRSSVIASALHRPRIVGRAHSNAIAF